MGFDLEIFFEGLEYLIINNDEEDVAIAYAALINAIKEGKKYAEECGEI